MVNNNNFKSVVIVDGKTVKEYNDELFNRVDSKECINLYHGDESDPFAVYGLQLSEFYNKETGGLSHGFVKIIRLEGEEIKFSTLRKMILQSEAGLKARDDSGELLAVQSEMISEERAAFVTKLIQNPKSDNEYLAAVCKKTQKSEFIGKYEPTRQFFIINKKTQSCRFVRPLFLNNFLSLINLEIPDMINEEDVEFEKEEIN